MSKVDFDRLVEGIVRETDGDDLGKVYDASFTPSDVVCGWLTALKQYVEDEKIDRKVSQELAERAAELTADFGMHRRMIRNGKKH
ncbi:MAG TPA: hypothetical protein VIY48_12230 [Candidatus Paceibacterota bacterium]